jgi:hypothetical protein
VPCGQTDVFVEVETDHGSVRRSDGGRKIMRANPAAALIQEYRRSHSGIGLGNHLIVATALTEGLEFAPLNIRHYPVFSGLPCPF